MGKKRRAWWILGAAIVTTIGLYIYLELLWLSNIEHSLIDHTPPGGFLRSPWREPSPTESEHDAVVERELALIIEEYGFKESRPNPYPDKSVTWPLTGFMPSVQACGRARCTTRRWK